jgi:hypothetical protein
MPRAPKSKGAKNNRSAQPKTISLKVAIEPSDGLQYHYVNYAEVSHSANEFGLAFVHVPAKLPTSKLNAARETGNLVLEPLVQLVIPAAIVPGLISALTSQRASYEEKFGKIHEGGDQ